MREPQLKTKAMTQNIPVQNIISKITNIQTTVALVSDSQNNDVFQESVGGEVDIFINFWCDSSPKFCVRKVNKIG